MRGLQEIIIPAQVADANMGRLSVKKIVSAGSRMIFDEGSYMEGKTTGERSWLTEAQGMHMLKIRAEIGRSF